MITFLFFFFFFQHADKMLRSAAGDGQFALAGRQCAAAWLLLLLAVPGRSAGKPCEDFDIGMVASEAFASRGGTGDCSADMPMFAAASGLTVAHECARWSVPIESWARDGRVLLKLPAGANGSALLTSVWCAHTCGAAGFETGAPCAVASSSRNERRQNINENALDVLGDNPDAGIQASSGARRQLQCTLSCSCYPCGSATPVNYGGGACSAATDICSATVSGAGCYADCDSGCDCGTLTCTTACPEPPDAESIGCYVGDGSLYDGYQTTTVGGRTCKAWAHTGYSELPENYCRSAPPAPPPTAPPQHRSANPSHTRLLRHPLAHADSPRPSRPSPPRPTRSVVG